MTRQEMRDAEDREAEDAERRLVQEAMSYNASKRQRVMTEDELSLAMGWDSEDPLPHMIEGSFDHFERFVG